MILSTGVDPPQDLVVAAKDVPPPGSVTLVAVASPSALKVAHSVAKPKASAIFVLESLRSLTFRYWGMATADRIPMIATTIISSTRVKPLLAAL